MTATRTDSKESQMTTTDVGLDRSPAGPRRQQRGIRLPQLMLSLLVVGVFALLAVWWQANTTARIPVISLAQDVQVGQIMTRADFAEMYVSADVQADMANFSSVDAYVGSFPLVALKRGTIISGSMFSLAQPLEPGQGLAGLRLDSGRAPFGLSAGDTVQVLVERAGEVEILAPDARIDAVRGTDTEVVVRLRMSASEAQRVQLSATEVVVIEITKEGPLSWETASS